MAEVTFKVVFDRNVIPKLSRTWKVNLGRAVAKIARDIEAQAKSVVPVDTGFLKNSIQARQIQSFQWEVTVGAQYGIYVEMGTRFMPPRPYLQPAVDRMRPILAEVVRQALEQSAREAGA